MISADRTHLVFENYRLDCRSGELRRNGREIKLQPQPAKLLVLLATRSGEIVTRAEIQKALWGDDTFVDFEHGINFCVKQIRDALGDSAEEPRYVETVPRLGYRFLGRIESDGPRDSDRELPRSSSHRRWKLGAGSLAAFLAIGLLVLLRSKAPPADNPQPRFQLTLPRGVGLDYGSYSTLAISPDGTRVAFVGCGDVCQIYLRDLSEIDARPLPGTEGAVNPFFSPDGRWLGFGMHGKLKKIDLEHETIVTLADALPLRGANWAEAGTIVFTTGNSGLLRVSADGGEVEQVTKREPGELDHRWPQILPGGQAVLFEVLHEQSIFGSRGHDVAVVELEKGTKRTLLENAGCPRFAFSGHVLFGRDGVLYVAPFDARRLEVLGPPVPVLDGVAMWSSPSISRNNSGVVAYDIGREGTLLFSPREARLPKRTLVSLDRNGGREPLSPLQRAYFNPQFSPNGRRIAVTVQTDVAATEAFVLDIPSGTWTRVDAGEQSTGRSLSAGWMPEGERLILGVGPEMLVVPVDGTEQTRRFPFSISQTGATGLSVAPDGLTLVFPRQPRPGDFDIWRVALTGTGAAEPWLATASEESSPRFSPDGQWVTYFSNDSGRGEVYVRPYAESPVRRQVSVRGGDYPQWPRDGKEIFFLNEGSLWSAAVRMSPTFAVDAPQKLFDLPEDVQHEAYDVSPDGGRFLMVQVDPLELRPFDLVVVPNWVEEMKARLAAAK
jgi:serine/threonine-protein kinase